MTIRPAGHAENVVQRSDCCYAFEVSWSAYSGVAPKVRQYCRYVTAIGGVVLCVMMFARCREPHDPNKHAVIAAASDAGEGGDEDDYEEVVAVSTGAAGGAHQRRTEKQEVEEGGAAPITLGMPFAVQVVLTNTGFVTTLDLAGKERCVKCVKCCLRMH
jgi:hypothetical protein